jgi:hypothetical protein
MMAVSTHKERRNARCNIDLQAKSREGIPFWFIFHWKGTSILVCGAGVSSSKWQHKQVLPHVQITDKQWRHPEAWVMLY